MSTHDEATIREALSRLTAAAWHQSDPERPKACFSIPADRERDADLILGAAIDELMALRRPSPAVEVPDAMESAGNEAMDAILIANLQRDLAQWQREAAVWKEKHDAMRAGLAPVPVGKRVIDAYCLLGFYASWSLASIIETVRDILHAWRGDPPMWTDVPPCPRRWCRFCGGRRSPSGPRG